MKRVASFALFVSLIVLVVCVGAQSQDPTESIWGRLAETLPIHAERQLLAKAAKKPKPPAIPPNLVVTTLNANIVGANILGVGGNLQSGFPIELSAFGLNVGNRGDLFGRASIKYDGVILAGGDGTSSNSAGVELSSNGIRVADSLGVSGGITRNGAITGTSIIVSGIKSAVIPTKSHGKRLVYCDESADVRLFDRGSGQLKDGRATIRLDSTFLETVTIDEKRPMWVQVTLTGECNGVFVAEKTRTSFTVKELNGGKSNATFDWEVGAKRKGFEDERLEQAKESPPMSR